MSEHETELERAVLGALCLAPERIPEVCAIVRTEDFQEHRSRVLFDCLRDLHARVVPIDFLTVGEALRADGDFQRVGGAQWLAELALAVTSATHVLEHARMLAHAGHERRENEMASRLLAAAAADRPKMRSELRALLDVEHARSGVLPLGAVRAADVEEREVAWLVPSLVPLGALSVLAGPGGLGKSTVAADLAAAVTTGREFVGHATPTGSVVYVAAEEDLAAVLRPKLRAAGANLERVHLIDRTPQFPRDAGELRDLLRRIGGVRLVVIDTLGDVGGTGLDENSNAGMRQVLAPLRLLAEEFDVGVLCVAHMRKGAAGTLAARVLGSVAAVNMPRAVLTVLRDPRDPLLRVLALAKANYAEVTDERHQFQLHGAPLRVRWRGKVTYSEAELLATLDGGAVERPLAAACQFLQETLCGGPRPTAEVERLAAERGISARTLTRARHTLGVVANARKGVAGGGWILELPSTELGHVPLGESSWRTSEEATQDRCPPNGAELADFEGSQPAREDRGGGVRIDGQRRVRDQSAARVVRQAERALSPSVSDSGSALAERGDEADVPEDVDERAALRHRRPGPRAEPDVEPGELFGDDNTHDCERH